MPTRDSLRAPRSPAGSARCSASGLPPPFQNAELVEDEAGVRDADRDRPRGNLGRQRRHRGHFHPSVGKLDLASVVRVIDRDHHI